MKTVFSCKKDKGLTVFLLITATGLMVSVYFSSDELWVKAVLTIFSIGSLIGACINYFQFVKLESGVLIYRENFKKVVIQKSTIEKVSWEKGCGVSIMVSGQWIDIPNPEVGAQSMTNSIRAWINVKEE